MIRIEKVAIREFRGIRRHTLKLECRNFAICGPNGTGKSGVVDAIEFGLTGRVSRLSGEGRGTVSLRSHGAHVDARATPESASVTIVLKLNSGKIVTLERNLKTPHTPTISPDEPTTQSILLRFQAHPEFVLSRREIIKFVLATPGRRAAEIQALLQFESIDRVRRSLHKIANDSKREHAIALESQDRASAHLATGLRIPTLTKDALLVATNARRAVLGLGELTDLNDTVSLKEGVITDDAATRGIPKVRAQADIDAALESLARLETEKSRFAEAEKLLTSLLSVPLIDANATRSNFYDLALELINGEQCPVCDSRFEPSALRKRVQEKRSLLKSATRALKTAIDALNPLAAILLRAHTTTLAVVELGRKATPALPMEATAAAGELYRTLSVGLERAWPVNEMLTLLTSVGAAQGGALAEISALREHIASLPETGVTEAARDYLIIAQERLDVYRASKRKRSVTKTRLVKARKVYAAYVASSDKILTTLYEQVQDDFARMYAFINRTDEKQFTAQLRASGGSVDLDVDFYGRGHFPPGAYHSEGHQDGMGLCLYLALMRHLHRDAFTIAILDDVLMSVDAGHRREVCALLKSEFPNTQFIITTHDPIWMRHMKTEGLISGKGGVQFRGWSVEHGPLRWSERDVWAEIAEHLSADRVRDAAGLLRHYLEYVAAELCNRLRAQVEFRSDAQYELGGLLPPAIARLRKLYSDASNTANSWGQREVVDRIRRAQATFAQCSAASQAESWQINAAVHYNSWATLTRHDFQPVADACRKLIDTFKCHLCGDYLALVPTRGPAVTLKCTCGDVSFNLQPKILQESAT